MIGGQIVDNFEAAAAGIFVGLVGPVIAAILALAANLGAIVENLTSEDPTSKRRINTLIDTPARMANAFLNGGQTLDLTPLNRSTVPTLPRILPAVNAPIPHSSVRVAPESVTAVWMSAAALAMRRSSWRIRIYRDQSVPVLTGRDRLRCELRHFLRASSVMRI